MHAAYSSFCKNFLIQRSTDSKAHWRSPCT